MKQHAQLVEPVTLATDNQAVETPSPDITVFERPAKEEDIVVTEREKLLEEVNEPKLGECESQYRSPKVKTRDGALSGERKTKAPVSQYYIFIVAFLLGLVQPVGGFLLLVVIHMVLYQGSEFVTALKHRNVIGIVKALVIWGMAFRVQFYPLVMVMILASLARKVAL